VVEAEAVSKDHFNRTLRQTQGESANLSAGRQGIREERKAKIRFFCSLRALR